MTDQRRQKIDSVLSQRQPDLTVLAERLHKPRNFSAIVRTCDAIGINQVHAVPGDEGLALSLIHISEPTRPVGISRMPSSA